MGFLGSIFGGGDSGGSEVGFQNVPESKDVKESRKRLFEIATGEPPDIPLRGIAPLQLPGEERQLARSTAKELIQPNDIFQLPEVQGIIQETTAAGDLLANRLSRMLQSSGNLTSTTGRDTLGRAVTDVQKSLASSLAPFASEERGRRTSLIPTLEGLGLTEEDRQRGTVQSQLDALFSKEFTESQQLQSFTVPLLQSIISNQQAVLPTLSGGQGQTSLEGLSGILAPMLQSLSK